MMNKIFKRSTISLISSFKQNNLLKFQFNTVKFFGTIIYRLNLYEGEKFLNMDLFFLD